ncbi:putative bifunctional diguanylate cyclase/phosphodiesterase [Specibacter sp. RAF43]|uniref:putative bifunctional diguanylate cyclase/phosphodiesterase n=1 Tax=Specibacter sp. RAF43 TaxID=3233057 RepID=UPI003F974BD9
MPKTTDAPDKRLSLLIDGIVRIAGGDLHTRIKTSAARDDLDAVIAGFNLMAEELLTAQTDLELRVESRTSLLQATHQKMRHMSLTDPLTELSNRRALELAIDESLTRAAQGGPQPALLLLDLDSFKGVNDSMGHGAGDTVLKIVADRLRATVRDEDVVARLGGDEFAVLLQGTTANRAMSVAARIVAAVRRLVVLEEREFKFGASVGIATPKEGDSAQDLLLYADTAMYAAKGDDRASVIAFEPILLSVRQMRSQLAGELRSAVHQNQLMLHYQPIVELATGKILGVEALIRWEHPTRGLLMPDDFIPLAEEIGEMTGLSSWVLRESAAQLHRWQAAGQVDGGFTMRVNLPASELQRPELIDDVRRILAEEAVSATNVVLELTESAMVAGNEWDIYSLRGLHNLGVGLEIDDFGTGYSSISYLRRLPIDAVKVDKSLMGELGADVRQKDFIAAILQLIHACGLTAVFEGIETREQAAVLSALGCHSGQGYFFSRPVGADAMTERLSTNFRAIGYL